MSETEERGLEMDVHETDDEGSDHEAPIPAPVFYGHPPRDRPVYRFDRGFHPRKRDRPSPPAPPIRCSWCWTGRPQHRQVTVPQGAVCEECESTVNPRVLPGPEATAPPLEWKQGELCFRCHLRIHDRVPEEELPLPVLHSAAGIVRHLQERTPPDIAQYQRDRDNYHAAAMMQDFVNSKKKRYATALSARKMKSPPE